MRILLLQLILCLAQSSYTQNKHELKTDMRLINNQFIIGYEWIQAERTIGLEFQIKYDRSPQVLSLPNLGKLKFSRQGLGLGFEFKKYINLANYKDRLYYSFGYQHTHETKANPRFQAARNTFLNSNLSERKSMIISSYPYVGFGGKLILNEHYVIEPKIILHFLNIANLIDDRITIGINGFLNIGYRF